MARAVAGLEGGGVMYGHEAGIANTKETRGQDDNCPDSHQNKRTKVRLPKHSSR